MAFKRLLIEFGQGVDMHGGDQNNAIRKATQDAVHHCCMAGISEIFEIKDRMTQTKVHADIYVPHPTEVHQGGANPRGIAFDGDPESEITIALVVLTVYVDV